jgi:hypothetical protein
MKLLDKLKNALFEEEYVEVEEKENKPKKEKVKKVKPSIISKQDDDEIYEEQKPIAKRIVPRDKVDTSEIAQDTKNEEIDLLDRNQEVKITMIDDSDLVSQNTYPELPPISEVTRKRTETVNYDDVIEEEYVEPEVREEAVKKEEVVERPVKLYQATKKESYLENYTPHEYGNYEKQKEKEIFRPSPIISPVYGIVEDTRFMEKPKREIRITTSISHDKINIDDIRRKAYGNLTDDIGDNVGLHNSSLPSYTKEEVEEDDENILLDLTNESNTPEVNNLTVGDAAMYFEDLGLEYNNDYIDADKTTGTSKSTDENSEDVSFLKTNNAVELPKIIDGNIEDTEEDISSDNVIVKDKDSDNTTDSDNLFDLIDSMYE